MLIKFKENIKQNNLIPPQGVTLLAVSGGIDSVVLVHLFHESRLPFAIAHCNFKLRGDESEKDEQFVICLADHYKVQCYKIAFDTKSICVKEKSSLQVTARKLRYDWFKSLLKEHHFTQIATAHHMNDRIETFLYNFTKGTGIRGLSNMTAKTGNIIRPLLFANKEEIIEYASKNNLSHREDASNSSIKYSRNRIRKEAIPVLKSINPSLEKTAADTFENLEETEAFFKWAIEEHRIRLTSKKESNYFIDFEKLKRSIAPRTLLFELIRPFGFTSEQVKNILHEQTRSSGPQFFTTKFKLLINRNQLIISEIDKNSSQSIMVQEKDKQISFSNHNIKITNPPTVPSEFTKSKNKIWIDKEKLQFPLTLRPWKPGDFFQPIGMKGNKQKIKKHLTNEKLSLVEKENVYVLLSGDDICWVVGYRMDERFKITAQTKEAILFELHKT